MPDDKEQPTPGIWFVGGKTVLGGRGPTFRPVCVVNFDCPHGSENATLISAAPDLLAACKAALEIRNTSYQVDANRKMDVIERRRLEGVLRVIQVQLEAAVSKAEGR